MGDDSCSKDRGFDPGAVAGWTFGHCSDLFVVKIVLFV